MATEILVPLDGSEKDARALAAAAALAELSSAGLHIVRVVDTAAAASSSSATVLDVPSLHEATRHALAAAAKRLEADAGRPVTWELLDGEDVASTLVRDAAARDALMVVMATRAPGPADRAMRGSVADRVMRESPRAVVLVPPRTDDLAGKHVSIRRVLVPLDGSALAARCVDFLLGLPRANELECVLLEVVPEGGDLIQAQIRLDAVADRTCALGMRGVEAAVIEGDDPALAICDAVRDALADMIAMSTRGASGLRRLVLGNVAEGVIRTSDVPLLLLTPASLART